MSSRRQLSDPGGPVGAAGGDEPGEVDQPVAVGGEVEMVGPGSDDRRPDLLVPLGGRRLEAGPQGGRVGLDVQPPPGLRVDHPEHADGRQLELAGIGDVHGHDLVAERQAGDRRPARPDGSRKSEMTTT